MEPESNYFKHSTDAELMAYLKNGDRGAFNEIYERSWKLLYNLAFEMVREADQTENVTTDVMISFWNNREKHKYPGIYSNLLKELQYQLTIHYEMEGNNPDKVNAIKLLARTLLQPKQIKADKDLRECIEIWLSTEPKLRLDICKLGYFEGEAPEQIAILLNLPLQDVKKELFRCFLRFEAFLKNS